MEYVSIAGSEISLSRIGLGTWSIGGWLWGGSDESESVKTIQKAFDKGINLIDTAPVYGFGHSEEIVGRALKTGIPREMVIIATKAGLEWGNNRIVRNSTRSRLEKEIDDSLRRLQTDYIDLYQIHWPDPLTPFEETAQVLEEFRNAGKIRLTGVSNYSTEQMERFRSAAILNTSQPPYNIFERGIEDDVMPYCNDNNITMLLYGVLCRGLLSGKINSETVFEGDDIRKKDPKFKGERFKQYLEAVRKLDNFAKESYNTNVLQLSVRWVLDYAKNDIALWGARKPGQLDALDSVFGWKLDEQGLEYAAKIVSNCVKDPVGPEFMAPPARN